MSVFDSPKLVDRWQEDHHRFPVIHDQMFSWVREWVTPGATVVDVGASTGLLSRHLSDCRYNVRAVEQPGKALERGRDAGVYDNIPVLDVRVTPTTLPHLLRFVEGASAVVGRRVLPELYDALHGPTGLAELTTGLAAAGVGLLLLEGRVPSKRTTHPLGTVDREAAACEGWRVVGRRGPLVALEPVGTFTIR